VTQIGDIEKKIDALSLDMTYLKGKLDVTLPLLARTEQVNSMIQVHKATCRKSIMPQKPIDWAVLLTKIGVGLGALAAAIYAFVEFLTSKPVP